MLEEKMLELSEKARSLAFHYYLRKGHIPPLVLGIIGVTDSVDAFERALRKYNPDEPRVPAGNPDGGQRTDGGGDSDNQPDTSPNVQMVQEVPPIIDPELTPEVIPEPLPGIGGRPLPANPDDLINQGYQETSHPDAAAAGHRTFENPDTGDVLRYDEGDPNEPGYAGQNHYHRIDPDNPGGYLDNQGKPVPRNSRPSHLFPPETA